MPVTIKMIAKKTGLSAGTVSQALRDDPRMAEATRAKVMNAAQRMGYVPSDFGRALRSGKSRMIGYIHSDITKSFYGNIMKGIADEAARNGYGILFAAPSNDTACEIEQIKYLEQKKVEGIIIAGCEPETWDYLDSLNRNGPPVVISSNPSQRKDIEEVITDDLEGGRMVASYLIGLGHSRLAYYNSSGMSNSRRDGFFSEVKKHDLPLPVVCDSIESLKKLLKRRNRPTAIFAYNDMNAVDVIDTADDIGIKVPEALSVIGYNDDVYSSFKRINLTTLRQQKDEIGRLSFINLLKKINGEKIESVSLKPKLIIRGSTGRLI